MRSLSWSRRDTDARPPTWLLPPSVTSLGGYRSGLQSLDEVLLAVAAEVGVQHGWVVLLERVGHLVLGRPPDQGEDRSLAGLQLFADPADEVVVDADVV